MVLESRIIGKPADVCHIGEDPRVLHGFEPFLEKGHGQLASPADEEGTRNLDCRGKTGLIETEEVKTIALCPGAIDVHILQREEENLRVSQLETDGYQRV